MASSCERAKCHSILQVISGKVRRPHCHGDSGVSQDFLQGEDVAAVLDEVTGEGVAKGVGSLPFRELDGGSLQGPEEGCDVRRELPVCAPVLPEPIRKLPGYRDGTDLT